MLKELQDLGLSEKEAKIYMAALELGPATADQLAKQSKIKRPTTYVQLQSLMKTGLMSTYEEEKKTYFAPESPELLTRLLQKQKENITSKEKDLKSLLPDLLRQFESAGERPVVRFFPGKDGISIVREEVLKAREKLLRVLLSSDNMTKIYTSKQIDEYTEKRTALGIHSRAIYTDRSFFDETPVNELSERRYIRDIPLTIDIRIFDDKVAIFSVEGTLFAMIIESAQISNSMKLIFDFLWSKAELPSKST
jgi:sugar-specific transcriptional regulator TrmB